MRFLQSLQPPEFEEDQCDDDSEDDEDDTRSAHHELEDIKSISKRFVYHYMCFASYHWL